MFVAVKKLRIRTAALLLAAGLAACVQSPAPDPSLSAVRAPAEGEIILIQPDLKVYDLSLLRIGMTKAEVFSLFGKPQSTKHTPRDEYWGYEWFELFFRDGRLVNWFDL